MVQVTEESSKRRRRKVRLPPTVDRILLHLRTQPRLVAAIALSAAALLLWWARNRPARGLGLERKRLVRYDRERDADGAGGSFPPLPNLEDRSRLWPPDLNEPLCDLKIFVYDLPPELLLKPKTESQCRWSAYNSELLLHKLLITSSPSRAVSNQLVTRNPEEADVFFIPLFPSCYLFDCWVAAGWKRDLRCDVERDYILPVMGWVKAQPFWKRNGGADHLIVHPMDFIDGYYTQEARSAMNSTTYLVTVGDLRPPPHSVHYRHHRDIVIPSSTHLLNSYYINPMDYLDDAGHPLVVPRGAANTARKPQAMPTHVEIWNPTSTPDLAWRSSFFGSRSKTLPTRRRTTTAIFRGGQGRPDEGETYALGIRSLFWPSVVNGTTSASHSGFSSLPGWDIAHESENDEYARALSVAKFGLAPPGYTLDTTRIWEYLAFGVVPVFIGTGPTGGQVMPFADDFDYSSFSISVPRERAHLLPEILESVGEEEYERLRRKVWEVGRLLVLEESRGNVWKWIGRQLCRTRRIGTGTSEIIFQT